MRINAAINEICAMQISICRHVYHYTGGGGGGGGGSNIRRSVAAGKEGFYNDLFTTINPNCLISCYYRRAGKGGGLNTSSPH